MFKRFSKINTFTITIFIFGILLGVLLGTNIKYLLKNNPLFIEILERQQQEIIQDITGSINFITCLEDKIECNSRIGDTTLAIIDHYGKIITSAKTNENGEVKVKITTPQDPRFNIIKGQVQRGSINVAAFKKGYRETVIFEIPIMPDLETTEILPLLLMIPNQRNEPLGVINREFHRLDIIALVDAIAKTLHIDR